MQDLSTYLDFFTSEKKHILSDFQKFLRFKSIATDPAYQEEVRSCATWLADYLRKSGLEVEVWETAGSPVLFAQNLEAGPDQETLLLYCHYDVQPVDPLDEWLSPPFEPEVRDGEIYARGACDNKGQCFYTILAIKALLRIVGKLPVNVKLIIEGEEESGSTSLSAILDQKANRLRADHLVIVDSGIEDLNQPAISIGARGIVNFQVTVQEADYDLHSGMLGGIAYNPNRALAEILTSLHAENGSVSIPGFYDEVTEMLPHEKNELSLDFDIGRFHTHFGFEPRGMERGISPTESNCLRPTLEICGMWGGYTGAGFKTVIPAKAHAKLSCRLVPNQIPERIAALVSDFIIRKTPSGLKTHVDVLNGSGRGFRTHPRARIVQVMAESYAQVFQKTCNKILMGGTIPVAPKLCEAARAEMVLVGLALPDDHIHAPNEHFGIDRLEKGFLTICRALELLGR